MATARERIKEELGKGGMLTSAELQEKLPEFNRGNIYTTISGMKLKWKEVVQEGDKYRLIEDAQADKQPEMCDCLDVCGDDRTAKEKGLVCAEKARVQQVPPGVGGRKPPVHWTTEERDILAVEFYKLKTEAPHSASTAFGLAQMILPESRRREITDWQVQVGTWLQPRLALLEMAHQRHATAPQQATAPAPIPPHTQPQLSTYDLVLELVGRCRSLIKDAVGEALKEHLVAAEVTAPKPPKHNPEMQSDGKVKLPRIMIVGLHKAHQQQEVTKEFEGMLDLRFSNTDEPPPLIRSRVASCDRVVLMSDYINHKIRDHFKYANVPHELQSGGVGVLKSKLADYAKELGNEEHQ
jgi:hypothetical protein